MTCELKLYSPHRTLSTLVSMFRRDDGRNIIYLLDKSISDPLVVPCKRSKQNKLDANSYWDRNGMQTPQCRQPTEYLHTEIENSNDITQTM